MNLQQLRCGIQRVRVALLIGFEPKFGLVGVAACNKAQMTDSERERDAVRSYVRVTYAYVCVCVSMCMKLKCLCHTK